MTNFEFDSFDFSGMIKQVTVCRVLRRSKQGGCTSRLQFSMRFQSQITLFRHRCRNCTITKIKFGVRRDIDALRVVELHVFLSSSLAYLRTNHPRRSEKDIYFQDTKFCIDMPAP